MSSTPHSPIGVDFQQAATKPSYGANWLVDTFCPLCLFQPPKALTFRNLDSQKLPVAHVARSGIEPASLTFPCGTKLVGKNLGGSINSRTVEWLESLSSEKQSKYLSCSLPGHDIFLSVASGQSLERGSELLAKHIHQSLGQKLS